MKLAVKEFLLVLRILQFALAFAGIGIVSSALGIKSEKQQQSRTACFLLICMLWSVIALAAVFFISYYAKKSLKYILLVSIELVTTLLFLASSIIMGVFFLSTNCCDMSSKSANDKLFGSNRSVCKLKKGAFGLCLAACLLWNVSLILTIEIWHAQRKATKKHGAVRSNDAQITHT